MHKEDHEVERREREIKKETATAAAVQYNVAFIVIVIY